MRRARLTGQAAVFEQVDKIINRFEYPDESGGGGGVVLGGGGGAPTLVVAPVDSLSIDRADVQCTGVNDEQPIQDALNRLSAAEDGRLLLADGQFLLKEPITVPSNVTVEGMGWEATYVTDDSGGGMGGPMILVGSGGFQTFHDFQIFAEDDTEGIGTGSAQRNSVKIYNVIFDMDDARAIHFWRSEGWHIATCRITSTTNTTDLVVVENSSDCWVRDNWFIGGSRGIYVYDNGTASTLPHAVKVLDNEFYSQGAEAVYFDGNRGDVSFSQIRGNFIQAPGISQSSRTGTGAIHVIGQGAIDPEEQDTEPPVIIEANILESMSYLDGIRLVGANLYAVRGNYIENTFDAHGIVLDDSSGCQVFDNTLAYPDVDNQDDAIVLTGDSNHNYLSRNTMWNDTDPGGGGSNPLRWRYGITVEATANCNIVVANQGKSFGTGPLNDLSATTRLVYPNDPTYGDNFFGDCGAGS